jgi:hypothetical protein
MKKGLLSTSFILGLGAFWTGAVFASQDQLASVDLKAKLKKIENMDDQSRFELPEAPVSGEKTTRIQAAIDQVLAEATSILQGRDPILDPEIGDSLNSKGYATEFKTEGECQDIKALKDCHVMVLGRRSYLSSTRSLQEVVDLYTSDLRLAGDKAINVKGIGIDRIHFEVLNKKAVRLDANSSAPPLKLNQELILKKCRNGMFISWRCNNFSYELIKINDQAYALLGVQLPAAGIPSTYKLAVCDPQKNRRSKTQAKLGPCEAEFSLDQKKNSSAGTLTLTLFVQGDSKFEKTIRIYEVSSGYTRSEVDAKKLLMSQQSLKAGLGEEYKNLAAKFERRP